MREINVTELKNVDLSVIPEIELECELSSWSLTDYKREVERNDSISLAAIEDNTVLGFIIMRLINAAEAEIYNLGVRRSQRRRGIGTMLLNQSISKAIERSEVKNIWLEARESNSKAIEFYRKNGFEVTGARKNFYANPSENAVLMRFEISPVKFF